MLQRFWSWLFAPRTLPRKGDFVRIVSMQGCMGNIRGEERVGQVVGSITPNTVRIPHLTYLVIKMADESLQYRPAVPELWVLYDGVLEYRV